MSLNYPEKNNNNSRHFSKHRNVNYVSTAAVQESPKVMLGTFNINSNSASVLFDSGASHTFISQAFCRTHSIPLLALKDPILVNSPGASMSSSYYCPSASLLIKGVEFEISLIVLRASGIDLILGMDWIEKHKAVIQCQERVIVLTTPKGERISAEVTVKPPPTAIVNQLNESVNL